MDRQTRLGIVLGLVVFVSDRAHKFVQIEQLGWRGGEFIRVTSFFDYVLVWNTGISYGLLTGLPVAALLGLMVFASGLLIYWWWREESALARTGLAICIGGAASHMIDRMIYGAVPDFFHFHWEQWSFYVFNISDSSITIGVVLLLLDLVWGKKRSHADDNQTN